jgi:succinate dehydrogenase/fumarate reductase flavoprotein subunit
VPGEPSDLIVVGAGTAGLACAVEAAEAGGRVLLLDKADEVGGTLHVSGGHLSAAGTRRQAARGIADTPDAHAEDVLRISGGTARADLVRAAVDLAPSTVDWLDANGFDFADSCPRIVHGHEPYGVARTYYGTAEARSILAVLLRLLQPHLDRGAIRLETGRRVGRLLTDGDRVTGVEVEGGGSARGRAVVLATGGFGATAELFAALERRPLFTAARPTSTGDGLTLARALGAAVAGRGAYLPTFGGLPEPGRPGRVRWRDRPRLVAAERDPWELYVDRRGRRFVAEDEPSVDRKERALLAATPGDLTFWMVLDDRAVASSSPVVVDWSADDLRAAAGRREGVCAAGTLEDLARAAGIDPAGLAATVGEYNRALAAGAPDPLGRTARPAPVAEPPFYALRNHGTTLVTFAGLDVDARLRVRRRDGSVIPGLYAAGEVLGAAATSGNAFCGGMLLTPALSFGRLLGRRLARRDADAAS